ncbi:hypothetical protein J2786_004481 [Chryseobacterium vietnamense]|uniref:Uncharacterized protein n=1 Tax=Chryseobacterium vietnamense TaxID=866785 RepID=A0ACC6JE03_9FLAO|nr:hypothetical protein [Chryseobacterium vietnamense]MDR6461327.1 hypothetical protein [Chryseobacterium vietnamense]
MNNYNVNKEMLGVATVFVTIFVIVPALSSYFMEDCKTAMERVKKQKCKIRVESIEGIKSLKLKGTIPESIQPCECYDNGQWWVSYKDEIEPGDYFIKNEGESYLEIIKEDTLIRHEYICSQK